MHGSNGMMSGTMTQGSGPGAGLAIDDESMRRFARALAVPVNAIA